MSAASPYACRRSTRLSFNVLNCGFSTRFGGRGAFVLAPCGRVVIPDGAAPPFMCRCCFPAALPCVRATGAGATFSSVRPAFAAAAAVPIPIAAIVAQIQIAFFFTVALL